MLKRIYWIFTLIFFTQPTSAIIFDAATYIKKHKNGSTQTVILFGDCHEYLHEITPKNRKIVKENTKKQRAEIIELAESLDATMLIEDMAYATSCCSIFGLPTMITLAMDRYLGHYPYQVITNLTAECLQHGINAYSIECRHADTIIESPPPYFVNSMRIANAWWPIISSFATSTSCFLGNFITPLWAHATSLWLTPVIKQPVLNIFSPWTLEMYQWLELSEIIKKAKAIHHNPAIQNVIKNIEKTWMKKNSCHWLDNFVDLKALNHITEHPEQETIIICAGAWHTDNIADYLEQSGYQCDDLQLHFAEKHALKINKEKDLIRPLSVAKTCKNLPIVAV